MAPARDGGVFLSYVREGYIRIRYLAPDGKEAEEWDIGPGTRAAMASDSQGNLHVAYDNQGPRYRKVELLFEVPGSPEAVIQAAPIEGFVPLTVALDGTQSHDTDGGSIIPFDTHYPRKWCAKPAEDTFQGQRGIADIRKY